MPQLAQSPSAWASGEKGMGDSGWTWSPFLRRAGKEASGFSCLSLWQATLAFHQEPSLVSSRGRRQASTCRARSGVSVICLAFSLQPGMGGAQVRCCEKEC